MNAAAPTVQVDAELADLIPQYLSHRWADLNLGRQYLDNGEFDRLTRMAHRIHGTAASYGFRELGEIARLLEHAAGRGDTAAVAAQLAAYDAFLCSVRIEYV